MTHFILATLIYAQRDDRVLMLHRRKEPNLGLWIAPGGKIDPGESPRDCAIRELQEETGLHAVNPELRAIITELSPDPDWQWLMFVYRTQVEDDNEQGDGREGRLQWFPVDQVLSLPIPQADAIFFPYVIDPDGPPREMTFHYNADLKLQHWQTWPLR
ncbi:MAG: DNA mismatch repair protein MutT [Clostridia bacterium]|nr:MAG: DNA mismatch repair protein MutT [Clostridia bacterium]